MSGTLIQISTFVNPHLFWYFELSKVRTRFILEETLQNAIKTPLRLHEPKIGDVALIILNGKPKRGLVKKIIRQTNEFSVWLVDHGILETVKNVYILPHEFVECPHIIKQGALQDVIYLKQSLQPLDIETTESIEFSSGSIKYVKDKLKCAEKVYFTVMNTTNQVHIGILNLIGKDGQSTDLRETMVKDGIASINKELFLTAFIKNSVIDDPMFNLFVKSSILGKMELDFVGTGGLGRGISRASNSVCSPGVDIFKQRIDVVKNSSIETTKSLTSNGISQNYNGTISECSEDFCSEILSSDSASQPVNIESKIQSVSLLQKLKKSVNNLPKLHKLDNSIQSDYSKESNLQHSIVESLSENDAKISNSFSCSSSVVSGTKLNILPGGVRLQKVKKVTSQNIEKSTMSGSQSVKSFDGTNIKNSQNSTDNEMSSSEKNQTFHHKNRYIHGCKCEACISWINSDVFEEKKVEFIDSVSKPFKITTKVKKSAPPLFKNSAEDDIALEITNSASIISTKSKIERSHMPKVLVHGYTLLNPVTSINAVPFHADIHRSLRIFEQVYTIQSCVWPSLMRHLNVCMVNPPNSGKTMAYLPAMCSYLLEMQERYADLPKREVGPIIIILCPGIETAEKVFSFARNLLKFSKNKPACSIAVPPLDKQCLNQFQKRTDFLVTTPNMLIQLILSKIITIQRLCHLVIEDCDTILYKFSKQIQSICNYIQTMLTFRSCGYAVQLVLTAEHWSRPLEKFVKNIHLAPIVCIGTYLEAALYGRTDIQLQFIKSHRKNFILCESLKENYLLCKTIVICKNNSEIDSIKEYFQSNGIKSIFIYDETDKFEILELEQNWQNAPGGQNLVLVCTDNIYNQWLNITEAVFLVHFSLPDTWTQFSNRFSCFLNNYTSPFNKTDDMRYVRCKAYIFVDEECDKQLPRLIQFLHYMGKDLSGRFLEYYKVMLEKKETEQLSKNVKLCTNLKVFGQCVHNEQKLACLNKSYQHSVFLPGCYKRHCISEELDYSNANLPKSSVIRFKILTVQSVNCFIVKLIDHKDADGKINTFDKFGNIKKNLRRAMNNQKISLSDAKVDKWYVHYSEKDDIYNRIVVKKILEVEKITNKPIILFVKFLDKGTYEKVSVCDLYEMPAEFKMIPEEGVVVYLANLIPEDGDTCWSTYAKTKVEKYLDDANYKRENVYATGQILLQLGNALWLRNILILEKLETIKGKALALNLKKVIIDNKIASYSSEQLQGLYHLCKASNIKLPNYEISAQIEDIAERSNNNKQSNAYWAFIDETFPYNEVYIACIESPSLFYVKLKKFNDLLCKLQSDIQTAVSNPLYMDDFQVEVGKYYLARDEESQEYCRVRVDSIKDNICDCFYVDFGDRAFVNISDIKYLKDEHLTRLPCQIIECRLYGVQPSFDTWEALAYDTMERYIFEPDTNYFRTLNTQICIKEKAISTDGIKYALLLFDNFNKNEAVLINKLLIDCGEAIDINEEILKNEYINEFENLQKTKAESEEDNWNEIDETFVPTLVEENNENFENDDSEWDVEIPDMEIFMNQFLGISDKISTPRSFNDYPEIKPLPSVDYCTPDIYWYQTETCIKLRIMLPNVLDCKLLVLRNQFFVFETIQKGKEYKLNLQLYNKIQKCFQHVKHGTAVNITLTKIKIQEWPRLILTKQRMLNIKFDFSHCSFNDDGEYKHNKRFLTIGEDRKNEDIRDLGYIVEDGSDCDLSESDLESNTSSNFDN